MLSALLQGLGAKIADFGPRDVDPNSPDVEYELPASIGFYCDLYCGVLHCPKEQEAARGKKKEERLRRLLAALPELLGPEGGGLSTESAAQAVSAATAL